MPFFNFFRSISVKHLNNFLFLRAVLVISGGFLVHLSIGTIYTFGNIAPYMVSYIRNQSHPASLKQEATTWIFACALIGQGTTMFIGGWMVRKIGPRLTTLIGGWTMSLGVGLSYFTIKISFFLLLLTYGLLFGIGVGVAYIGPLTSAMMWMPKRKGFANGVVVAGFGLGSLIFNAVQTSFVNPHNKVINGDEYFTDPDLLHRVPSMFLLLGGIYAVMQLIGSLLITNPPEDYYSQKSEEICKSGQYHEVDDDSCIDINKIKIVTKKKDQSKSERENLDPDSLSNPVGSIEQSNDDIASDEQKDEKLELLKGSSKAIYSDSENNHATDSQDEKTDLEESGTSNASSVSWGKNVVTSLKPLQMLKKSNFYFLWCMFFANSQAILFTSTLYKFFGQGFIGDDHFLAIVGSVAAIFNCSGRVIWGIVADKISYKYSLVIVGGIMTVFVLTFYACTMGGKYMFFIWVCIMFFCIGGNFSLFPTAIGRAFGLQYVSVNYGLLFTSQIISGSMGALLSTTLKTHVGYYGLFFIVSGFSVIGFLLAIVYKPKRYISLQPK